MDEDRGRFAEVRGKTLGIIGYGHIGTQVGVLAESLGMTGDLLRHRDQAGAGQRPAGGVARCTARSRGRGHAARAGDSADAGMIGPAQVARMKPGSALINASRGSVVDIDALVDGLKSKHLSGAAIDVFPAEPKGAGDEFVSPLRGMDNVILTPHVGGSTEEAQENIGLEVAEKLIKYSNNGSTLSAVNFPEVSLPEHAGQHRLLHIHRNQPGVLSAINQVFSEQQINIAGQYLQTNPKVGYVVIDIEVEGPEVTQMLKRHLDEVPGTIRSRILY